jgi:hypothetical protein
MAASVRVPLGDIENILKDLSLGPIGVGGEAAINAAGGTSNALHDVGSTADFLTRLSEPNLWIRVGEGVAGLILIAIGLKVMFPSTVAAVSTPVKAAGTAALFA